MRTILVLVALLIMSGCTTVPSKLGQQTKDQWYVVGQNGGVEVQAWHATPVVEVHNSHTVSRDVWYLRIVNNSNEDWCIHPEVLTMDYKDIQNKTWWLVRAGWSTNANVLVQKIWLFDKSVFVFNDAKVKVNQVQLRKPDFQNPHGYECLIRKR